MSTIEKMRQMRAEIKEDFMRHLAIAVAAACLSFVSLPACAPPSEQAEYEVKEAVVAQHGMVVRTQLGANGLSSLMGSIYRALCDAGNEQK